MRKRQRVLSDPRYEKATILFSPVAQLAGHLAVNQGVAGSIPAWGTK